MNDRAAVPGWSWEHAVASHGMAIARHMFDVQESSSSASQASRNRGCQGRQEEGSTMNKSTRSAWVRVGVATLAVLAIVLVAAPVEAKFKVKLKSTPKAHS